jgi:hypothetical protein
MASMRGQVGVAQLLQRLQVAAAFTHTAQGLDEVLGLAPQRAGDVDQQCLFAVVCASSSARAVSRRICSTFSNSASVCARPR